MGEIIDFAVQVANEHMVPEGMAAAVWGRLTGAERFYLKMMDIETTARASSTTTRISQRPSESATTAPDGLREPNKARLKTADWIQEEWLREHGVRSVV